MVERFRIPTWDQLSRVCWWTQTHAPHRIRTDPAALRARADHPTGRRMRNIYTHNLSGLDVQFTLNSTFVDPWPVAQ